MAGISVQQCINLIMQHIGYQKVGPTFKEMTDGTAPVKQLGMGSFSTVGTTGLSSFNSVLNGASIDSVAGNIMQNPIASAASGLTGSVTSGLSTMQSLAGNFDPMSGSFSGGKFSLEQVNAMTSKLNGSTLTSTLNPSTGLYSLQTTIGTGGISSGVTNLLDHTDKMAGLKTPNYENIGEFGFSQMMSTQTSIDRFTSQIPKGMDTYNLGSQLTTKANQITAPLEMAPTLLSTKTSLDQISSLNALSGSALTTKYNSILSNLTTTESSINGVVTTSKNSMTSVINASEATALPAQIASISSNDSSTKALGLLTKVVQPTKLATIKSDNAKYGYGDQ